MAAINRERTMERGKKPNLPSAARHGTWHINEQNPNTWTIPPGFEIVEFSSHDFVSAGSIFKLQSRMAHNYESSLEALYRHFASSRSPDVYIIRVAQDSALRSAKIFTFFPNVHTIQIYSTDLQNIDDLRDVPKLHCLTLDSSLSKIGRRFSIALIPELRLETVSIRVEHDEEVGLLNKCVHLTNLVVHRWPTPNFEALRDLRLKRIAVATSPALRAIDGLASDQLVSLSAGTCGSLRAIGSVSAQRLEIEKCVNCDLTTIGRVESLVYLRLTNMRPITSFKFLESCATIEQLVITATKIEAPLNVLCRHPKLKTAFLPTVSSSDILHLKDDCEPNVIISNGTTAICGGRIINPDDSGEMN